MAQIIGSYTAGVGQITAGKNLGFKIGLESALASITAVEGVFYLTSDTRRLYIGLTDGNLAPVNQGVITVATLPSENVIPGQFYYVSGSNILATFNGSKWVQLNPDTYVASLSETIGSATNKATVQITATHGGGQQNAVTTAGFDLVGGGSNKVTVSGKTITITDADYGMSATGNNADGVKINLTQTPAGGTEAVKESVTLKASNGVTLSRENDVITIDGSGIVGDVVNNNVEEVIWSNGENGGFVLSLKKHDSSTIGATVNPVISYGNGSTAKFQNGTATLSVYTKEETEDKIANALMNYNALMYKGTVGGSGADSNQLPQSDVSIGDVYVATGSSTLKVTQSATAQHYDAGTLFIANGPEGADGKITANGVTWAVVQNYNTDTQTKFNQIDYGFSAYNQAGNTTTALGGLVVKPNETGMITASQTTDSTSKVTTVTLGHKAISYANTAATVPAADATKYLYVGKAIETLGTDAYGHLQTSAETAIAVPTELFTGNVTETVGVADNTATMEHTLGLKVGSQTISTSKVTSKVKSDTLTLTSDSNALAINLTWGSF